MECNFMPTNSLTEKQIRELLASMQDNQADCGFDAFVVMKDEPKLRTMVLSEKKNANGKSFRDILKDMVFCVINESYLSPDAEPKRLFYPVLFFMFRRYRRGLFFS